MVNHLCHLLPSEDESLCMNPFKRMAGQKLHFAHGVPSLVQLRLKNTSTFQTLYQAYTSTSTRTMTFQQTFLGLSGLIHLVNFRGMPAHGVARSMLLLANIDLELPNYFRYFIAAYADPSPAVCKHLHSKGPWSL